ncbi:MAG: ATP-binding protein [Bacilli bacterium]|jgi:predicted ATP-binding protein involved in virulence|nr:ATP-binding protein [Bacilli bacterium]
MIRTISWDSHPILGNLSLCFNKTDGSTYDTIIFAGENGAGKTTVLESLSNFLRGGSFEYFKSISYSANSNEFEVSPLVPFNFQGTKYGFHIRKNLANGHQDEIQSNENNNHDSMMNDANDIRSYGFSYSRAKTGFNTRKITATSTSQLDEKKVDDNNVDDFTSVKQLIVDLASQDNSDWMDLSIKPNCPPITGFLASSRLERFRNAFNNFFTNLAFSKIVTSNANEIEIVFTKNGKEIPIDNLSTGEKQIVFRGAQLLKNQRKIAGGIVLIDEPELSLHPQWQEKILDYYRGLFTVDGKQTVQILIATHSEHILDSAFRDSNNILVISLTDNKGQIVAKSMQNPGVLPTITSAEINYEVFGISSNDYHIEFFGYLQRKQGLTSIKSCDQFIESKISPSDPLVHKKYIHNKTIYFTLPTYIRNCIDHPDSSHQFNQEELKRSIQLLITLCK